MRVLQCAIVLASIGLIGCNPDGTLDPTLGGIVAYEDNTRSARNSRARTMKYGEGAKQVKYQKGTAEIETNADVDTAYIKIKREFGFLTVDERLARSPGLQEGWLKMETSFKHEAIAGVSYRMRNRVPHTFEDEARKHNLEALVEKDGTGSTVSITFWMAPDQEIDVNAYTESIKARAMTALGT